MKRRPEWPKPVTIAARATVERLDERTGQLASFSLLQPVQGELRAIMASWGGVLTDRGVLIVPLYSLFAS